MQKDVSAITGAFGFTGRHIARRLVAAGHRVINLTNHPDRPNEFGEAVTCAPLAFLDPEALAESLCGADVLFNTYWIRFAHGETTFDQAIENSMSLIRAAKDAGVRRIVHVSITNPSHDSPLPYFRGKAIVEDAIKESGLSYAILRPAVIFGDEGILINNIAWFLRRLPVFAVPGSGEYGLQPIYVEDLAELAVRAGQSEENVVVDAVGPETFTFNELIALMKTAVGSRTLVLHAPPQAVWLLTWLIGRLVGDVVLTYDEVKGLLGNLLASSGEPTGSTRLSDWLDENKDWIGKRYFSELSKHFGQKSSNSLA